MRLIQPKRFHPGKAIWLLAVLAVYFLVTTLRDREPASWSWRGTIFGSTYGVQFTADDWTTRKVETLQEEVESILKEIDASVSTWRADSSLSQFNALDTTNAFAADAVLIEMTRMSLVLSQQSGGAFDVTYAPMFSLWGFGEKGEPRVPTDEQVRLIRSRCGWRNLEITGEGQLRKRIAGLQFNLNAIAPGYAAQRIADLLQQRGITNLFVDVGGEEVVRGGRTATRPWRLGIETPTRGAEPGAALSLVVELRDGALATSGDYRNYFQAPDGRHYSHLFDPRIGGPVTSRVASVSVIHTNGAWADALATTLFVLGPDEGLSWLTNIPSAEACFLIRDGDAFVERVSPGFAAYRVEAAP